MVFGHHCWASPTLLGLQEWFGSLQPFLQELEVGCSGRIFKIGGETKDAALNFFRLHRSNVQEIVGIDMVNHCAVGKADHHLHGEVVFLQMQGGQLAGEFILSPGL